MADTKITREHLLQRQDEIRQQLAKLDGDLHEELDRDPDEQSIQLEQQDVTLSMVGNLNKELRQIETMLVDLEG